MAWKQIGVTPTQVDQKITTHNNVDSAHGATSAATASKIMMRDASGRARVAAPSDSTDIARKHEVDTHANLTDPHSATSAATADRLVLRDASGRARVSAPDHADDIARKHEVDTHAALTGTSAHGLQSGATKVAGTGADNVLLLDANAKSPLVGTVVQEVVATRNNADTTSSVTATNSGISASITPVYNNSILEVEFWMAGVILSLVSGSVLNRIGYVLIRNSTDGVNSAVAQIRRQMITGAGGETVSIAMPMTVKMRYTVNSTAERTFAVQFYVSSTSLSITFSSVDQLLTIKEIKQ